MITTLQVGVLSPDQASRPEYLQTLPQISATKTLATCLPSQTDNFPSRITCRLGKFYSGIPYSLGSVIHYRFLRQPFQHSIFVHLEFKMLRGCNSICLVPFAGTRGGQQRVPCNIRTDSQLIPSGHTARRMQQNNVTDATAFRVERLLHNQRAAMLAMRQDGLMLRVPRKPKLQGRLPFPRQTGIAYRPHIH